jgi:hypothetical protein
MSDPAVEVDQVWRHKVTGDRMRVMGFTRIDNPPWVRLREIGGRRSRCSYPAETLRRYFTPELPKAQHGQEDTSAPIPPKAQ